MHSIAKAENLLHVMMAVDSMKDAPLARGKRAENRVIEQTGRRTVFPGSLIDYSIHVGDPRDDVGAHFFGWKSSRRRLLGSDATLGKIAAPDYDESADTIFKRRHPGERGAIRKAALKPLGGGRVGEVEVFEDLGGAPFTVGMPSTGFGGEICGGGGDVILESFKIEIHGPPQTII
jgi:hypothetical protein